MIDGYLTPAQAAAVTGYSRAYITQAAARGKIPGVTLHGQTWAIPYTWAESHHKPKSLTQQAREMGISRETYYKRKKKEQEKEGEGG